MKQWKRERGGGVKRESAGSAAGRRRIAIIDGIRFRKEKKEHEKSDRSVRDSSQHKICSKETDARCLEFKKC